MATPRMIGIQGAFVDTASGDIKIQFRTESGQIYTLHMAGPLAPPVVAALLGLARLNPQGPASTHPMTLTGVGKVALEGGQLAIELRLDGGLPLTLLLSPESLAGLRSELAALAALQTPPQTPPH